MRKRITTIAATAALAIGLTFAVASPAGADDRGPCNGNPPGSLGPITGANYAAHHIVFNAKACNLGAGGHIPGAHRGFSVCR